MTSFDRSDQLAAELPDLLLEIAAPQVPDYTDDVLAITARTGQRPRWTFPERWLPMIIARQRIALPTFPWRPILAVLTILALLAAAVYVASMQRRVPAPFGPARNGAIVYGRAGDLFIRDTLDAPERLMIGGAPEDIAPGFTRDGRHLTFLRRTSGSAGSTDERLDGYLADLDGSNAVDVTGPLKAPNWADLSPDDAVMVVQAATPISVFGSDDLRSRLYRVDLRHPGVPQPIDLAGLTAATTPSFRGPDGAEIVFRGFVFEGSTVRTGVFAARPDGSGLRPLTPTDGTADAYQQPLLSPDGRLLTYTTWTSVRLQIHVRDLASGADRTITAPDVDEGYATFSPDGSRVTFVQYTEGYDQIMLMPMAPGSVPVAAGPIYPQVDGQYISSAFSPDGRFLMVNDPASKETRIVDAVAGGDGDVVPWATSGFGWQRLAP